jgi:stress response protein YsnF
MDNHQLKNDNKSKAGEKGIDTSSIYNNNFSKIEEIVKTIPLFEEKITLTKKTEETQLILKKKLITSTKKIEIPIKHEEIYINGKEFDSYDENEITEIFSKIKHKITDAFSHEKNGDKQNSEVIPDSHNIEVIHQKNDPNVKNPNNSNEQIVPLSIDENNHNTQREENIVPIWGEEIIINKRMVKLGEIVIKKYKTNEKRKIEIDVKTEQITVKYPDNYKEEII